MSSNLNFCIVRPAAELAERQRGKNFWFYWIFDLFCMKINSKLEKFDFSKIFKIITFFRLRLRTSGQVSTPMEPIDALILLDGTIFYIFALRKWPQIEIWTYKTSSNFNFKTLASQKCRRPSAGRFARTPYYSSSWDETSCSTSHWISLIMSTISARSQ